MPNIKPISDLRNYSEVLHDVAVGAPVFLTKNGRGRYAIVDIKDYEKAQATLKLMNELAKGRKSGEEKECWRLWRNTSELTVNALCLSHEAQRKGKTLESSRASSVFCHHGRSGGIR